MATVSAAPALRSNSIAVATVAAARASCSSTSARLDCARKR
jgi:hypothetical protein